MNKKLWYKSKTIWTFVILAIVSILNTLGVTELSLSPDANWVATVFAVLSVLFRLISGHELIFTEE